MMKNFKVPSRDQVSENNQSIFDNLKKALGFIPNLYAYYAKSEHALGEYLQFQNRKSSLSKKEKEVINLVVSEYNDCYYCQSAHTVIAGLNGLDEDQILSIRQANASFDKSLNALAKTTLAIISNRGKISEADKDFFFEAGYNEENLIDLVMNIGEKTISNYIHNIAQFEIDFPKAPRLETAAA